MSAEWIKTTIGEYCPFVYGKAIKKVDQKNDGISVYGSNGVYTYSDGFLVDQHAVIIGRKGSVGKVHLSIDPCWVSDTAFFVKKESLEESYFVYYLLSSLGLEDMNTDAAVPGLNRDNAHRLEVTIPATVDERIALVEPLIKLDQKIALNQKINQTLEQIAQAFFKSWFVDFEPVKAKVAVLEAGGSEEDAQLAAMQVISGKSLDELTRFQSEHPEQYAELCATAELFPAAMQDSELGEIPEGWRCLSLDKIATYLNGLALQKFRPEEDEPDFLPVLKISHLRKGTTDGEEKASIHIKSEYIVENGDVIFSWSGSLLVDVWCGGKAALNQHLFKVTSDKYPKWLYYLYTKHHLAEFQRIAAAKAVTMGHIKREHLREAQCVLPSDKAIQALNSVFENLIAKMLETRLENNTLGELLETLLPKLIFGELSRGSE